MLHSACIFQLLVNDYLRRPVFCDTSVSARRDKIPSFKKHYYNINLTGMETQKSLNNSLMKKTRNYPRNRGFTGI